MRIFLKPIVTDPAPNACPAITLLEGLISQMQADIQIAGKDSNPRPRTADLTAHSKSTELRASLARVTADLATLKQFESPENQEGERVLRRSPEKSACAFF